jgi:hypothetical protein
MGLDVHSDTRMIAVAESVRTGDVRFTVKSLVTPTNCRSPSPSQSSHRRPDAHRSQDSACVYDDLFGADLARFIEDARVMPAIPEIQSYRQSFCIHKAEGL